MSQKSMPVQCPGCKGLLKVRSLTCSACNTTVSGNFDLPVLARLPVEDQEFIVRLLEASGSLKELARMYGISYPTVRNRVDSMIEKVAQMKNSVNEEEGGNE